MLNGSAYAYLLYTIVCLRRGCGLPVVQVVTHNFRLNVTNEPPGSMLESYIYMQQFPCSCDMNFSPRYT